MIEAKPLSQARTDRRTEIADAALRVLGREGHVGLTARKVAAEAGLSLGHITYHFSGMDEVLAEAYRLLSARLREASDAALAQAGPEERLSAFLRTGFTDSFLTPAHIRTRIDLWSAATAHPAVAETERALYAHYRQSLQDLLQPLVPQGRIMPLADTIIATLDGLWLDWMRRRDRQAVQHGLTVIEDLIRIEGRRDQT
jgi:AcrR family transcriptional regulator